MSRHPDQTQTPHTLGRWNTHLRSQVLGYTSSHAEKHMYGSPPPRGVHLPQHISWRIGQSERRKQADKCSKACIIIGDVARRRVAVESTLTKNSPPPRCFCPKSLSVIRDSGIEIKLSLARRVCSERSFVRTDTAADVPWPLVGTTLYSPPGRLSSALIPSVDI